MGAHIECISKCLCSVCCQCLLSVSAVSVCCHFFSRSLVWGLLFPFFHVSIQILFLVALSLSLSLSVSVFISLSLSLSLSVSLLCLSLLSISLCQSLSFSFSLCLSLSSLYSLSLLPSKPYLSPSESRHTCRYIPFMSVQ